MGFLFSDPLVDGVFAVAQVPAELGDRWAGTLRAPFAERLLRDLEMRGGFLDGEQLWHGVRPLAGSRGERVEPGGELAGAGLVLGVALQLDEDRVRVVCAGDGEEDLPVVSLLLERQRERAGEDHPGGGDPLLEFT